MHLLNVLLLAGTCTASTNIVLEKASSLVHPSTAHQTALPHPSYTYSHELPKVTAAASSLHGKWESLKSELGKKKSNAVSVAKAQVTGTAGPDDDDDDDDDYDWDYRSAFLQRGLPHFTPGEENDEDDEPEVSKLRLRGAGQSIKRSIEEYVDSHDDEPHLVEARSADPIRRYHGILYYCNWTEKCPYGESPTKPGVCC